MYLIKDFFLFVLKINCLCSCSILLFDSFLGSVFQLLVPVLGGPFNVDGVSFGRLIFVEFVQVRSIFEDGKVLNCGINFVFGFVGWFWDITG